jgi:hypothetical protein
MQPYLADRLFRIGLAVLLLGSGPLLVVILLAKLGVTSDPNPNPVGPGLLAGFTLWPALILMAVGVARVRRRAQQ